MANVNTKANYINHVAIVLDASSSMGGLERKVVQVADEQVKNLARLSKEMDQETRISVYTFADYYNITCPIFDKDALRLPSIAGVYKTDGNTALVDATLKCVDDLKKTATMYGDHAFLVYVLTDGQENNSRRTRRDLEVTIQGLPENWTMAAFVPGRGYIADTKSCGFPEGNIKVWETSERGMEEVGRVIQQTTQSYMTSRSTGTRGYKNLFEFDTTALTKANVNRQLVKKAKGEYKEIPVDKVQQIWELVEKNTGKPYKIGSAYYQLSKVEKLQADKEIAVMDKTNGNLYVGSHGRQLLNLPDHEVKVGPTMHKDYTLFIQSKSVNRKVMPGTVVVLP